VHLIITPPGRARSSSSADSSNTVFRYARLRLLLIFTKNIQHDARNYFM
jgi:hypothetical protein